jgi:hypothetical protein
LLNYYLVSRLINAARLSFWKLRDGESHLDYHCEQASRHPQTLKLFQKKLCDTGVRRNSHNLKRFVRQLHDTVRLMVCAASRSQSIGARRDSCVVLRFRCGFQVTRRLDRGPRQNDGIVNLPPRPELIHLREICFESRGIPGDTIVVLIADVNPETRGLTSRALLLGGFPSNTLSGVDDGAIGLHDLLEVSWGRLDGDEVPTKAPVVIRIDNPDLLLTLPGNDKGYVFIRVPEPVAG